MNKADAPQTDDPVPEAVGPITVLRRMPCVTLQNGQFQNLRINFVNCDSDKSKTISATLQNMEELVDSENFIVHTKY